MIRTNIIMMLVDPGLSGRPCLSNIDPHLQGILHIPGVFKLKSSFTEQRKLVASIGRKPTDPILCFDSTLLMWLKV